MLQKSSPTEYFWYRQTLDISPDIDTPDRFNWRIAGCLLLAWFFCYLCMAKGIASSGKVRFDRTLVYTYCELLFSYKRPLEM